MLANEYMQMALGDTPLFATFGSAAVLAFYCQVKLLVIKVAAACLPAFGTGCRQQWQMSLQMR